MESASGRCTEKQRLDQALNAKEFALLGGLSDSTALEWMHLLSITYYAPQPRAVLRIVNPSQTHQVVAHGDWGRVELTTLTKEFFMPRFLERDEAIRRPPPGTAWPRCGPFGALEQQIAEGVY